MTDYAIGIDLGTTFSCVAVVKDGQVRSIHNDGGPRITDSCIAFTEQQRLIGQPAKVQAIRNFRNTVFDVKRLIGRKFEEDTVQQDINHWPFDVINVDGGCKVRVQHKGQTKTFSPEELSAMVLTKMKESAEAFLRQKKAVITVPAYFNDAQRQATVDAATIAGLHVLRIINEPTAAGIAYIIDDKTPKQQTILVYDLGGGTFDVTIMTIENGFWLPFTVRRRSICVKSTSGDTHLGGNDFDMCLTAYCAADFKERYDIDITNNQRAMTKLRKSCEETKKILSNQEQTSIEVEGLADGIDYSLDITRTRFDKLCEHLFKKTLKSVDDALVAAKLSKEQIDEIILVGGSTRILKIQSLLREFFGGKELNKSIQPDEVVAHGAAIQAAILAGNKSQFQQNVSIQDVTPLTLGLRTRGGHFSKMIMKNTPIPAIKTGVYITAEDNQRHCEFSVFEGEYLMSSDNNFLGQFMLLEIREAPKVAKVTFEINENGILDVKATERGTNNTGRIRIVRCTGRLSKEEIALLVQNEANYVAEDKRLRLE